MPVTATRPTRSCHSSATTAQNTMLQRNGEGSVTQVKALLTSATTLGGTTNYSYDAKSQLTSESSTRAGGLTSSFAYDNAGNPTTWNRDGQNLVRTFNSNNQETTLGSGGATQFVYDGNGKPTKYPTWRWAKDSKSNPQQFFDSR